MSSAAASGAHLNGFGGSAGLGHDSQGTFGARRTDLGSSTAGSGMLDTRGGNAHLNSATETVIRRKK
jgi:hypothetical protein